MPNHWQMVRLIEVFEETKIRHADIPDELPVLSVLKLGSIVRSEDYFNRNVASRDKSKYKIVHPLDWAYSTIHINEGSIARNCLGVSGVVSPMYTTMRWASVEHEPEFFMNLLTSPKLVDEFDRFASGSVNRRKSLKFDSFANIQVAVPPLVEQRRIVDLLGAIERYIDSLQTQVAATRAARLAVVLDLLSNPADDWQRTTLDDVSEWSSGKLLPADRRIEGGKYRVLGASSEIARTDDWLIDYDAVLVGRVGAVGVVQRSSGPVWVSDNALIARPRESLLVDFLAITLESFDFSPIVSGNAQPVITQGRLKEQSVVLPPLAQQQKIVELVGSIDRQVSSLELQLQTVQLLRASVLAELLSGERLLDESYDVVVSL